MAQQHVTQFTIPANDQTPIVLTGFGHTPEVVFCGWNGRTETTDAVGAGDSNRGFGWAISAAEEEQETFVNKMVDGAPASDSLAGSFFALVSLVKATGAGAPPFSDGLARVSSIDEDGVTLAIVVPFSIDLSVTMLSLGPELVTQKAVGLEIIPNVTGDQDVTGLGFQPTALWMASTGREPSEPSFAQVAVGIGAGQGSTVNQAAMMGYSRANGQSSDTKRFCRRGRIMALSNEAPTLNKLERRASLSEFLADGFRLNWDLTTAASTKGFGWLALDGPGFEVSPFTVGQEAVTGLPYVPRGGIFISAGQEESPDTDDVQVDDQTVSGIAAINESGLVQFGGATRSEEAQPQQTIATRRLVSGVLGAIEPLTSSPAGVADGEVRLGPMRNDGFDLQTPDPFDEGDVFAAVMSFGAPQPTLTDGRKGTVPAGSQKPPVETFVKDPGSTLDYALDWTAPLSDATTVVDSIVRSSWSAPSGIQVAESPPSSFSGVETRVWLSGGSDGTNYDVVNRIETANGRVYERTIRIQVRER